MLNEHYTDPNDAYRKNHDLGIERCETGSIIHLARTRIRVGSANTIGRNAK